MTKRKLVVITLFGRCEAELDGEWVSRPRRAAMNRREQLPFLVSDEVETTVLDCRARNELLVRPRLSFDGRALYFLGVQQL